MKTNIASFSLLLLVFVPIALFCQPATRIRTSPAKSWVEKFDIEKQAMPASGQESSFYYLLLDEQENIPEQEKYVHYAYKILTSAGIQQMSDLNIDFDPAYEQLILHVLAIHRDGKIISQLTNNVRTIQREQSMDRYLYDGSLSAIINLADVRVGDIIEYAFTRKGYNPVYDGYVSRRIDLNFSAAYEKGIYRLIAPSSLDLSIKYVNTDNKPAVINRGDRISYTWKTERVKGFISDNHQPDWYDPYSYVLITNFRNWAEMAAWSAKRYQVSDREMGIVLREIYPQFHGGGDQDEYALRVIRFVQDEIRYLGFESGLNSHKPHAPAEVYYQRFGDCKDKSLLLSTLLRANGIEAYPVLVNTSYREKIAEMPPSTNAFDHCVVQFKLHDRTFYVDPTINDQGGSLENYYFPAYGAGLVVSAKTTDIVDLPSPKPATTSEVQTFDIDSIGGEGVLTIQTTYTGSDAERERSYFSQNNLESVLKNYLTYYANIYPDIEKSEAVRTEDDRVKNIFVVSEKYRIPSFWKPKEDRPSKIYCEFYPQTLESYFNVSKSMQRKSPYRLAYPLDYSHKIIVNLPESWNVPANHDSIETDFYQYAYDVQYEDNRITLSTHYKTKNSSIPTDEFPNFVEDHGKMMSNLSYSLSYDPSVINQSTTKMPGTVLSLASLAIGTWLVFWLYRGYDPKPYYPAAWGQSIGGWLILVAIGITLTPLRLLYSFITEDFILSGQGWLSMWYAGNYGYFIMLLAEHIYNVVFFTFALVVLILFFQRRSSAPLLISILYGVSCVVTIADTLLALQIDPNTEVDSREIMRSIIGALVWIPYFQMSQRVKRTFVNLLSSAAEPAKVAENT